MDSIKHRNVYLNVYDLNVLNRVLHYLGIGIYHTGL